MPNYIKFDDNHPDKIMETWNKMVDEVKSAYLLPPTKKKVCVDIGCNLGSFMAYAKTNGAFENIYGFEPALQTYHACLSMLKHFNVLDEDMQVRNLAVTEESGQVLRLFDNGSGESGNATLLEPEKITQIEHCLTIGLDDIFDILQLEHIDYLKMDCEGAEVNVIAGCSRIKDIDVMAIETHAGNFEPLRELLMNLGFFTVSFNDKEADFQAPLIWAFNTPRMLEDLKEYYYFDGTGTRKTIADLEQKNIGKGGKELNYEALCKSMREKKE